MLFAQNGKDVLSSRSVTSWDQKLGTVNYSLHLNVCHIKHCSNCKLKREVSTVETAYAGRGASAHSHRTDLGGRSHSVDWHAKKPTQHYSKMMLAHHSEPAFIPEVLQSLLPGNAAHLGCGVPAKFLRARRTNAWWPFWNMVMVPQAHVDSRLWTSLDVHTYGHAEGWTPQLWSHVLSPSLCLRQAGWLQLLFPLLTVLVA